MPDLPKSTAPVVFLNSHPIQYFAPLYQYLNQQAAFSCTALYCSTHGLQGEHDKQFGVAVQWDLPILEGYPAVFLKNFSFRPSIYHFWGLLNFGVWSYLYRQPKSIVIVHGWNYATHIMTLFAARMMGHTVCLRAETPANQELLRSKRVRQLRALVFKYGFSRLVDYYLPIGAQNQQFYRLYGIPDRQLIQLPYAVDNERFQQQAHQLATDRNGLCAELGIDPSRLIFLFVGKYIGKKRPLDILHALAQMKYRAKAAVLMVGEGELRAEMEELIQQAQLEQVILSGFVNQSQIARYYAAADVFVLPSEQGETWGLVANEAANFALPLILSDQVGSAQDLVEYDQNGYTYPCGDIDQLQQLMDQCIGLPIHSLESMGQKSLAIIEQYSFKVIATQLQKIHC